MSAAWALSSWTQSTSAFCPASQVKQPFLAAERMPLRLSEIIRIPRTAFPWGFCCMADLRLDFIRFCVESGVLTFGQFKTKAGRITPYFFNAGSFDHGAALGRLAEFYAKTI